MTDDLKCPTCHGTGHVPNRWIVRYRRPSGNGTAMTTNGAGGFTFAEAQKVVADYQNGGDLAWMEPVNEGYPDRTGAAMTPTDQTPDAVRAAIAEVLRNSATPKHPPVGEDDVCIDWTTAHLLASICDETDRPGTAKYLRDQIALAAARAGDGAT